MKDLVVAAKYAHALFAQAQEKNELRACQQGLEEFIRVIRLRSSMQDILVHPFIAPEEKKRMIHSALGEYATPLLERFLALLVRKRRLNLLFEIAREFQTQIDRAQNTQAVTVRAAFPMPESQQKMLQGKLEAWFKSKVRLEVQVDPQLIGGLVVQTPDFLLDHSLKGQLQKLQQQLTI